MQAIFCSPPVSYADIPLREGDFAACGRKKSACKAIFYRCSHTQKSLPPRGRWILPLAAEDGRSLRYKQFCFHNPFFHRVRTNKKAFPWEGFF